LNPVKVVVDLLIPKSCFSCGKPSSNAVCQNCASSFKFIGPTHCLKCGYPTILEVNTCRQCRGKGFRFREGRSLLSYEGAAKDFLLSLKLESGFALADSLAKMAIKEIEPDFFAVCAFTFIPTTAWKKFSRGHNSSELIAKSLSHHLKIPLVDTLDFQKKVKDQAALEACARQENLKGAFKAKRNIELKGPVMIVDDIFTSGATLKEAARALAAAGLNTKVFTVARTL